jgi:hypothetical protein
MNQGPEKNGNDQAEQEDRKLMPELFNFSLPRISDKINDFGFQVVVVRKRAWPMITK